MKAVGNQQYRGDALREEQTGALAPSLDAGSTDRTADDIARHVSVIRRILNPGFLNCMAYFDADSNIWQALDMDSESESDDSSSSSSGAKKAKKKRAKMSSKELEEELKKIRKKNAAGTTPPRHRHEC